jgi:predicted phage terminase large subunit-like protein
MSFYGQEFGAEQVRALPAFEMVVHSWDTALKDKTSSDFVAGQVWGVKGADRYLLRLWHGHASLNATIAAMRELRTWSGEHWKCPQHLLIENTSNGPDAIREMRQAIDGVHPVRVQGDKVQRALAASPALETKHCYLPGMADPQPASVTGYLAGGTPADVQAFVEEAAMFRGDMQHAHDDQVDAWSQMVNWTRRRGAHRPSRLTRPSGKLHPASLPGY